MSLGRPLRSAGSTGAEPVDKKRNFQVGIHALAQPHSFSPCFVWLLSTCACHLNLDDYTRTHNVI